MSGLDRKDRIEKTVTYGNARIVDMVCNGYVTGVFKGG